MNPKSQIPHMNVDFLVGKREQELPTLAHGNSGASSIAFGFGLVEFGIGSKNSDLNGANPFETFPSPVPVTTNGPTIRVRCDLLVLGQTDARKRTL
ncbi:MAG: hypothetical protein GY795_00055 [Desulfobacterales bacterium]|nr:hypothetical protein [Desulfobacterales bacterium]